MTRTNTHFCDRCRITVDDDKLADSNCSDSKRCPLNPARLKARAERDANRSDSSLETIWNGG